MKRTKPWATTIQIHGKKSMIGRYSNAEEAAKVYDSKARELFGEFANTNFPEEKK